MENTNAEIRNDASPLEKSLLTHNKQESKAGFGPNQIMGQGNATHIVVDCNFISSRHQIKRILKRVSLEKIKNLKTSNDFGRRFQATLPGHVSIHQNGIPVA